MRSVATSRRPPRAATLGVALLIAALHWSVPAGAQRNLREPQSDAWYATQAAVLGGATAANTLAFAIGHPSSPRLDAAFDWERGTERNLAAVTSHVSDGTLITSVAAPLGTLAGHSASTWGDAVLVYGETLQGALLLNTLTKKSVARARPYTHHPQAAALVEAQGSDAFYSFYSGHSALSFAGAAGGSYLFSAIEDDVALRSVHWGTAFALASFTAHARVRAGRHYPTDVLAGSAIGVAWGATVPLLHGIRPRLEVEEVIAGGGGLVTGALVALALPTRDRSRTASGEWRLVPTPGGAAVAISW